VNRVADGGRHATDRGSASLAVVAVGLTLVVLAFVGSMVVRYVSVVHQARAAADLAAVTAATQAASFMDDDSACAAAGVIAGRNGAVMTSCQIVRAGNQVGAEVEVGVATGWTVPVLPQKVSTRACAANSP